jgi:hypothetical protein
MSLSAVQASNMAAKMAVSGEEMASGASKCGSCNDDMSGAMTMACDAICVAPVTATVPQTAALLIERPLDRPLTNAEVLSDWAVSPNPHPPKLIAHI